MFNNVVAKFLSATTLHRPIVLDFALLASKLCFFFRGMAC